MSYFGRPEAMTDLERSQILERFLKISKFIPKAKSISSYSLDGSITFTELTLSTTPIPDNAEVRYNWWVEFGIIIADEDMHEKLERTPEFLDHCVEIRFVNTDFKDLNEETMPAFLAIRQSEGKWRIEELGEHPLSPNDSIDAALRDATHVITNN